MERIISLLFCSFWTFSLFPNGNSLEKLNSQRLQSLEKTIISCDSVATKYFQVRNSIKRFEGNENVYYLLGSYRHGQNDFEIIQVSNGYTVTTYLVSISNNPFPQMLLIDQIVGGERCVSFEIFVDKIFVNITEPYGDAQYKYSEIYSVDKNFSEIKTIRNEGYNEVPLIISPE